ncbi:MULTISPECIES: HNH endonuclease [unclassified Streptomyces]|uniref:HNH endonuclease n=1 Tax=Streptomyces sp. NPDC056835 TaxID=3345956 RepID=UPI0036BED68F
MVWASSNRRSELPPTQQWERIRRQVIRRDRGVCQGVREDESLCTSPGTDVDHIHNPHDHSLGNLQLLCAPCHRRKTQSESLAARQRPFRPAPTGPGSRREAVPDVW